MNKTTKNNIKYWVVLMGIIVGIIAGLAVIASFVVVPQPTQYMSSNLFPLHVFYPNGDKYTFYPQIQPNGTACIQYIISTIPAINYTTQNSSTITTTIYNATQVKDMYLAFSGDPFIFSSNSGIPILIQPGETLLCPDIEKGR
ncbi:MAG: hypothetical protein QXS81_05000 [Candidatus Micrarchaeaceae archaeon]